MTRRRDLLPAVVEVVAFAFLLSSSPLLLLRSVVLVGLVVFFFDLVDLVCSSFPTALRLDLGLSGLLGTLLGGRCLVSVLAVVLAVVLDVAVVLAVVLTVSVTDPH